MTPQAGSYDSRKPRITDGGLYGYAPGLRGPEDETTDALGRVLDGAREGVRAVLSYDPEPGKMLTEHTRKIFYGRVA